MEATADKNNWERIEFFRLAEGLSASQGGRFIELTVHPL
jgi:hypothetical protein